MSAYVEKSGYAERSSKSVTGYDGYDGTSLSKLAEIAKQAFSPEEQLLKEQEEYLKKYRTISETLSQKMQEILYSVGLEEIDL